MAGVHSEGTRSGQLDRAIHELLSQTAEIQAAAVVSFDGLPMAAALPPGMDEDRVAAMSAALLSLGERATEGLGRGALSQVFIEGENGTVFLVSADDEAVLVAVANKGAKTGMMLYEVKRAANRIAGILRAAGVTEAAEAVVAEAALAPVAAAPEHQHEPEPVPVAATPSELESLAALPSLTPPDDSTWVYSETSAADGAAAPSSYAPLGSPESNGSGSAWA